jgi:hypothetical protein
VVIPADPADPARDKMRIPGILVLHENAVTPEDGRGAMAFDDLFVSKIYFRKNAQTSDDPGDRIPGHFHDIFWVGPGFLNGSSCN